MANRTMLSGNEAEEGWISEPEGLITDVDLRTHENNLAHRTREIDRKRLIVRRGQPFSIALQCNGPLPPKHHLELVLHLGKRDEVVIKVQKERGAGDRWWFNQQGAQDEMLLTLHSPADAIIGQYSLAVLMMSPEGRIIEKKDKISFHLLYNPWCKDDVVYLPDETLLQEYMMNENGIIYMGTWNNIKSIHWNYGQFEDYVMDICFEVLDNSNDALRNSQMDIQRRSDPVYVSRIITAMVNSNDDRGILTGRWTEPYSDGVAPYRWTGSVPILRQWSKSGVKAVKYGQCWVFAAVACTVLRCLGIPTRHITNFSSAHDVDGNLSIDFLLDEQLEPIESKGRRDSSWNFHCWTESWMRRDDLPEGNDGWQVLDPTPQELSDGVFCCGPCPVTAIKEGNLGVKYDAPFIFAEVNADIIFWIVQENGQRRKIKADQTSVGKNISTKSVYGDFREDVTLHYKYPEGSKKEREVYEKSGRRVTDPTDESAEPARLQLSIKHAKPVFGTDFDVIIEVENKGDQDAHVQLTVLAMAVTYTSVYRGECQRQMTTVKVPAHKAQKEVLHLRYDDYAKCVSDDHLIRVKAFVGAAGENEPIMTVTDIPLSRPEVFIQVSKKVVKGKQVTADISFTNPLPVTLRDVVLTVEGAGLLSSTEVLPHADVAPGQKVFVRFPFSPMRTGVRKLLVDIDADKLKDVKGVANVIVRKKRRLLP
ncbi:protein-glutamine gamma-glutamyltransferase 2-like [Archocentrus centrarchus]|uniref:protein-glutamine gamma-glutamyltransferase 2-like n=1 Tax=Archocentrus centrarchus TaxID=63155 RepID=UPI0011E9FDD7|nr:protein-glutamine gamma-glutamyltransferase 2-like [Archocentrus centrarchus]